MGPRGDSRVKGCVWLLVSGGNAREEKRGLLSHQEAPVRLETFWAEGSAPPNPGSVRAVLAGRVKQQRGSEASVAWMRGWQLARWLEPS
jgi:hypothetical protein